MKFNMKSLLKNKYVLYIVFFLAITNFFGYVLLKNYDAVVFMVLVGLVTSYFSKNMIIILVTAIASTTLLTTMSTINEGFKEGAKSDNEEDATTPAPTTTAAPTAAPSDDEEEEEFTVREEFGEKKKKKKKRNKIDNDVNMGVKSLEALEPLMAQAEGMINVLNKTNALKRMEGLVTKIDTLT